MTQDTSENELPGTRERSEYQSATGRWFPAHNLAQDWRHGRVAERPLDPAQTRRADFNSLLCAVVFDEEAQRVVAEKVTAAIAMQANPNHPRVARMAAGIRATASARIASAAPSPSSQARANVEKYAAAGIVLV